VSLIGDRAELETDTDDCLCQPAMHPVNRRKSF